MRMTRGWCASLGRQALVVGYEDGKGKHTGAIGSLICRSAAPLGRSAPCPLPILSPPILAASASLPAARQGRALQAQMARSVTRVGLTAGGETRSSSGWAADSRTRSACGARALRPSARSSHSSTSNSPATAPRASPPTSASVLTWTPTSFASLCFRRPAGRPRAALSQSYAQ